MGGDRLEIPLAKAEYLFSSEWRNDCPIGDRSSEKH